MGKFVSYARTTIGRKIAEKIWEELYETFNPIGITEARDCNKGKLPNHHPDTHRFHILEDNSLYRVEYGIAKFKTDWSKSEFELSVEYTSEEIPRTVRDITQKLRFEEKEAVMF